jgi:hypothetical protein
MPSDKKTVVSLIMRSVIVAVAVALSWFISAIDRVVDCLYEHSEFLARDSGQKQFPPNAAKVGVLIETVNCPIYCSKSFTHL